MPATLQDAPATEVARMRGYVKSLNPVRAFGTIMTDDSREFFFHFVELQNKVATLAKGCFVEFTPVKNPVLGKKDRALKINVLS